MASFHSVTGDLLFFFFLFVCLFFFYLTAQHCRFCDFYPSTRSMRDTLHLLDVKLLKQKAQITCAGIPFRINLPHSVACVHYIFGCISNMCSLPPTDLTKTNIQFWVHFQYVITASHWFDENKYTFLGAFSICGHCLPLIWQKQICLGECIVTWFSSLWLGSH